MKRNNDQNIKVFVRVRPFNDSEYKSASVVQAKSNYEITVKDSKQANALKTYSFNHVFGPDSPQVDVYRSVVQPLIPEVLQGYNCTVFAYGQTGTGKTFTMEGERSLNLQGSWENDPLAGIVPRTLSQLFDELRLLNADFIVKVSFLELYNEELFDLLSSPEDTTKLRLFEDSSRKGAVIISGLEEVTVHSKADVYQILEKGSLKRQTAATLLNAHSSRSHTVFTVTVNIRETGSDGEDSMRQGKINLVDLAGSENIGRSGAVEKRAREAGKINQSLLTLGRVINALVDHCPHIPYRQSKLTRILQESLGGCTQTSIIATVSPAACNLEETLSTLDYAHRAKNIKNKPEINRQIFKKTLLKEYCAEIERLQRDLEATRQKTGVYLAQGEYDNMLMHLEQLEADEKMKMEEIEVLDGELKKMQALCDELFAEKKAVEEEFERCSAVEHEKVSELSQIKNSVVQTEVEAAETDYLLKCHMNTYQKLLSQAENILQVTEMSTQNAGLLFDKLDRTRNASDCNETKVRDFAKRNKQFHDWTKDLIKHVGDCLMKVASSFSEISNASMSSMDIDMSIDLIVDANSDLGYVQESFSNLRSVILKVQNAGKASFESSLNGIWSSILASETEVTNLVAEKKADVECSYEECDKSLYEMELKIAIESQCALEVLEEWLSKWSVLQKDMISVISAKFGSASKIFDEVTCMRTAFSDKYKDLIKCRDEKFDAILCILSEIDDIDNARNALTENHLRSVREKHESLSKELVEAAACVEDSIEREKFEMDAIRSRFEEKVDFNLKHVESCLSQLPANPDLLRVEKVPKLCQDVTSLSESFRTLWENHFENKKKTCEFFSSTVSSLQEEVLNVNSNIQQMVNENIHHYLSKVDSLKSKTVENTEYLQRSINSLEAPLLNEVQNYQNSVLDVVHLGAKAATPTGKTPARSDLRLQSDLVTTSPHDKILSRLRSKYRQTFRESPGDSSDGLCSDTEVNNSVLDMDILAYSENNENSIVENPEKKSLDSKIPVKRMPLFENR